MAEKERERKYNPSKEFRSDVCAHKPQSITVIILSVRHHLIKKAKCRPELAKDGVEDRATSCDTFGGDDPSRSDWI